MLLRKIGSCLFAVCMVVPAFSTGCAVHAGYYDPYYHDYHPVDGEAVYYGQWETATHRQHVDLSTATRPIRRNTGTGGTSTRTSTEPQGRHAKSAHPYVSFAEGWRPHANDPLIHAIPLLILRDLAQIIGNGSPLGFASNHKVIRLFKFPSEGKDHALDETPWASRHRIVILIAFDV